MTHIADRLASGVVGALAALAVVAAAIGLWPVAITLATGVVGNGVTRSRSSAVRRVPPFISLTASLAVAGLVVTALAQAGLTLPLLAGWLLGGLAVAAMLVYLVIDAVRTEDVFSVGSGEGAGAAESPFGVLPAGARLRSAYSRQIERLPIFGRPTPRDARPNPPEPSSK